MGKSSEAMQKGVVMTFGTAPFSRDSQCHHGAMDQLMRLKAGGADYSGIMRRIKGAILDLPA